MALAPTTTATKPFIPSSSKLNEMIASAEVKFAAAREQALLREEARAADLRVRALVNADKARFYRRIQHGIA